MEACVTAVDEAVGAEEAGAHRLELCANLETGGLTPPLSMVAAVKRAVRVPVFVMVRPRAGAFVFSADEVEETLRDMGRVADAGADGVVVGFLTAEGEVDAASVARAVSVAGSLPVTFHRAFDRTPDLRASLGTLASLGVRRILTGGGPGAARHHADALRELVREAEGGVEILVGGQVRGDHARHLVAYTGAREVHARAEGIAGVCRALRGGG